jgi:hypothetical protein
MNWLSKFNIKANFNALYISFISAQLCTVLATHSVCVQGDIMLKGANKITAFSYLYRDMGKSTLHNVSRNWIMRSHQIIGDKWAFSIDVTIFCLTLF